MLSVDYQIDSLLEDRNHYLSNNKNDKAYYVTRNIIAYITRLIFAIGWSKIRESVPENVNQELYNHLFRSSRDLSIAPGKFYSCLKKADINHVVNCECDVLASLTAARNLQSHDDARDNFKAYFQSTEESFHKFECLFSGKSCAYIVPFREEGDQLACMMLKRGDKYASEISLRKALIPGFDKKVHRLFYQITNQETGSIDYYCLSPYIAAPSAIDRGYPVFRFYSHMADAGLGSGCLTLVYQSVMPFSENEEKKTRFESDEPYLCAGLFAPRNVSRSYIDSSWLRYRTTDVFINLSSYPGFQRDILNQEYLYCKSICPVRDGVLAYCLDRNNPVAYVTGNGGVGKTALMLSILCEIPTKQSIYGYTNLIFLSAKKKYVSFNELHGALPFDYLDIDAEADIHGFPDLVTKLGQLLELDIPTSDIDALAERVVRQVSDTANKRFLLIIDDLDSLPPEDQQKIEQYAYRFNAIILKTLITTRDHRPSSPVSFAVKELEEAQSLTYAQWYVENRTNIGNWNGWNNRMNAEKWIRQCGEGNPLIIQMLLTLVHNGLADVIEIPRTHSERTAYLYSTIQNLLSEEVRCVFQLLKQLYMSLPKTFRSQEIPLAILEYLSVGCGIESGDFKQILERLRKLKLVFVGNNELQCRPYTPYLFSDGIAVLPEPEIPKMYEIIWRDVAEHPWQWLSLGVSERTLADVLMDSEANPDYSIVVVKQILEYIKKNGSINEELRDAIADWCNRHSTSAVGSEDRNPELTNRLIQEIETTWRQTKVLIESGQDSATLERKVIRDIRSLRKVLTETPNKAVMNRLNRVTLELSDYGVS